MKAIGVFTSAVLSLVLGIAAPAYAQKEQQSEKQEQPKQQKGKEQPKPEQQRAQQSQNQSKQPQQQQEKENQGKQQEQHAHSQQSKPQQAQQQEEQNQNKQQHAQQQNQNTQRHGQQQHVQQQHAQQPQQRAQQQQVWQEHRAKSWQSNHRNWQQRGGYNGYRIPDDRFRGYFGSQHAFRIYGLPFMVYEGHPRFQYEGYWIARLDPWPEYWSNDWYDNDDVYVTYGSDGYYMYDRRYPGIGIAINISM